MSIPVELDALEMKTGEYGWAYLLTVRDDLRAHIVAVSPLWDDGAMVFSAGRGTARNAEVRPSVSIAYPPLSDSDGYTLIIDGDAAVENTDDGTTIRFAPTGAVLHRPSPDAFAGSPTGCASDCLPVE